MIFSFPQFKVIFRFLTLWKILMRNHPKKIISSKFNQAFQIKMFLMNNQKDISPLYYREFFNFYTKPHLNVFSTEDSLPQRKGAHKQWKSFFWRPKAKNSESLLDWQKMTEFLTFWNLLKNFFPEFFFQTFSQKIFSLNFSFSYSNFGKNSIKFQTSIKIPVSIDTKNSFEFEIIREVI